MYTNKNLEVINDNAAYIDSEGVKYPRNFPKSEITELYQVTETDRPTDTELIVEGFSIDETYTQVWNTRVKTAEEFSNELRDQALQALNVSDMVAIRCIKAGVSFPLEWQEYVGDLRDVVNDISTTLPIKPEYPIGT